MFAFGEKRKKAQTSKNEIEAEFRLMQIVDSKQSSTQLEPEIGSFPKYQTYDFFFFSCFLWV